MNAAYFIGGFAVGAVLVLIMKPASESTCCQRVAFGARDKISSFAGGASGTVSGALDATGITKHLPSLLDAFGVPLDA